MRYDFFFCFTGKILRKNEFTPFDIKMQVRHTCLAPNTVKLHYSGLIGALQVVRTNKIPDEKNNLRIKIYFSVSSFTIFEEVCLAIPYCAQMLDTDMLPFRVFLRCIVLP